MTDADNPDLRHTMKFEQLNHVFGEISDAIFGDNHSVEPPRGNFFFEFYKRNRLKREFILPPYVGRHPQ